MNLTAENITTVLTWGVGGFTVLAVFYKFLPMVFDLLKRQTGSIEMEKRVSRLENIASRHNELIDSINTKQENMGRKLDSVKETVDRSYGVLTLIKKKVFSSPGDL